MFNVAALFIKFDTERGKNRPLVDSIRCGISVTRQELTLLESDWALGKYCK